MKISRILMIGAVAAMVGVTACGTTEKQDATAQEAMSAYDCIMTRYSVRNYTAQTVAEDTVNMLVRAGMAAPTAVDRRPWHFVVIEGEPLTAFKDSMGYRGGMKDAPLAIAVCGNTNRFLEGAAREYWVQDCSAATENILLAANALGLGSVWTGVYPIPERVGKVTRLLSLPDSLIPLDVILLGYPTGEANVKDKWNPADMTVIK